MEDKKFLDLPGLSLFFNKLIGLVKKKYNVHYYGVAPENDGSRNSQALQALIDKVSSMGGGTIYIPSGSYNFASNTINPIGECCIKMKNNISIEGDGSNTILYPSGNTSQGLDMFYFNDYADTGSPVYLENCTFSNFVIDAYDTSTSSYTSAGKGFMLNLIKNCHWENVIVKNTDATGFGVDCPINCSITKCVAESCGKAAQISDVGASGFGIGFGYSYDESIIISGCTANRCRKFGFFFEHQRKFSPELYTSIGNNGMMVCDCSALGNYYNFGGVQAISTTYRDCVGRDAIHHGFFFENSENCTVVNSESYSDGDTSFVVYASNADGGTQENKSISFIGSISKLGKYGAKIVNDGSMAKMEYNIIKNCLFNFIQNQCIVTNGIMESLFIEGNMSDQTENDFSAQITNFINKNNSWNIPSDKMWMKKSFIAFGTSITYLCSEYNGGYLERIKQICGFDNYTNAGVSGAPMVNNTENGNGINYAIKNTEIDEDLILIECCTNDFKLNVPIGLVNTENTDTFSGALKDALNYIFTTYPDKQIIIIADPQRNNDGYDINHINIAGCRLLDYIDMAIMIGNQYGVPVCDLYRNSGINIKNMDLYTVDGLHPNEDGYKKIGECVSGIVETLNSSNVVNPHYIDEDILLNDSYYDISLTAQCKYKLIMLISGTYYLYQSHMPIWIYMDEANNYYETFDIAMTSRLSASENIFDNAIALQPAGVTKLDNIFSRTNSARTIDQFICANHDIYLWGTNTKILRKSFA